VECGSMSGEHTAFGSEAASDDHDWVDRQWVERSLPEWATIPQIPHRSHPPPVRPATYEARPLNLLRPGHRFPSPPSSRIYVAPPQPSFHEPGRFVVGSSNSQYGYLGGVRPSDVFGQLGVMSSRPEAPPSAPWMMGPPVSLIVLTNQYLMLRY